MTFGQVIIGIFGLAIAYMPYVIYMFLVPRMVHFFQMEGYKTSDYIRWLGKNIKSAFKPGIKQLVAVAITATVYLLMNNMLLKYKLVNESGFLTIVLFECFLTQLVYLVLNVAQIVKDKKARKNAKKKLVYTKRAKRLMVWNFVLYVLLVVSFIPPEIMEGLTDDSIISFIEAASRKTLQFVYYSAFIMLIPLNVVIANFLAWPGEQRRQDSFIRKAKKKLNKKNFANLIKIGITGSYGKTSTKFILKTILSEKYKVLATPESYNTTNGNLKVINNELLPEHEVFISEMGARYKGDIKEICNFVVPKYTIITSIGPQHLETFKSIENIIKTKSEIISGMDEKGTVFLPLDNEHCRKIYKNETHNKCSYSMENKNADVYAKDVTLDENGSNFTAVTKIGNIKCKTKLLGEHNIANILGCIAMAIELGMTAEEIERGVQKIEPVEHRLQILNNNNGTIVIDDAFNSNPVGAKMAIDVLGKFKGRKIVITPGMVELGKEEKNENKKFGKHMAGIVDIVILVGMQRSKPIAEGLREGKFDEMNIFVVEDLKAATAKLAEISRAGDVILFENDLPDSYNE